MSIATTLLKGAVTRVSQTFVSICVAFFMMPFLIGELGDHWYGVWTVVGSLAAAYHLFDMGMASAVTRYVSKAFGAGEDEQANQVINTALLIYTCIAMVIIVVSLCASFATGWLFDIEQDRELVQLVVLIIGLSIAFEFPFNALAGVASAKLKFHQVAGVRILITILSAWLNWHFVSSGHGILAMAIITFSTARLSNLLYFLICKRAFSGLRFSKKYVDQAMSKDLFGYSLWSFVIAIAYQMRNNVDNFVIAGFLSAASVTPYAIGLRLVDYLAQFLSQATNMFIPIFTAYHAKEDTKELNSKLLFITRLNLVLALIAGGGLTIFGDAFITRWIGPDYDIAYWVMVILLTGRMIGFANHPLNSALYAINKHKIIAKLDVIEVALNLALSLILVQFYGLIGVALGTMIPLLLLRLCFLPAFACKALNMPIQDYYLCMLRPVFVLCPLLYAAYLMVSSSQELESYAAIFSYASLMAMTTGLIGFKLSFSESEKQHLRKLLPSPKLNFLL